MAEKSLGNSLLKIGVGIAAGGTGAFLLNRFLRKGGEGPLDKAVNAVSGLITGVVNPNAEKKERAANRINIGLGKILRRPSKTQPKLGFFARRAAKKEREQRRRNIVALGDNFVGDFVDLFLPKK